MSEEEKKAMEYLRFYVNDNEDEYFDKNYQLNKKVSKEILNLIEKQQEELNKEKEKNKELEEDIKFIKTNIKENNYISKDKIRKIIQELEKEQEENRKNLSIGIELLSNKIIDKFSDKIIINFRIREYLENILKGE